MNRVELIGRLTAKPELRYTSNNKAVCNFSIAVNRNYKNEDGENIEEQFLNSIFKPYEKGSKGQFGLGMSIVKKTVDFFGMNMIVRNEEPKGVSFLIKRNENIE